MWQTFNSIFPKSTFFDMVIRILISVDIPTYNCIRVMFYIILRLSEYDFSFIYEEIQDKIYLILGIFMLFRLTVSLLTYFVNPDKIADKEQGAGKLVSKIVIMLVMLIAFPNIIFPLMNEAQSRLLVIIPRVVTTSDITFSQDPEIEISEGDRLATGIYKNFFALNPICSDSNDKAGTEITESFIGLYELATEGCSTNSLLGTQVYRYTYTPFLPAIVGIIALVILIGIAFQVAIRALKLIVLKILAPIAIVSYVNPKSGKDNGVFSNWVKALISTWADLFVRFSIFYLGMSILIEVLNGDLIIKLGLSTLGTGNFFVNQIANCIVVIALLFFIWKIPKYIKSILGIKEDKEFGKMISLGKVLGGAGTVAAVGTGTVTSGLGAATARAKAGGTTMQNVGAGLFGAFRGATTGINAAKNAKTGRATAAFNAISVFNVNNVRAISSGRTLLGSLSAGAGRFIEGLAPVDKMNADIKMLDEYGKIIDSSKSLIEDRVSKDDKHRVNHLSKIFRDIGEISVDNANYKEFLNAIETAKSTDGVVRYNGLKDANGNDTTISVGHANYLLEDLQKKQAQVMLDFASSLTSGLGTFNGNTICSSNEIDNAVAQAQNNLNYALGQLAGKTYKFKNASGVEQTITFDVNLNQVARAVITQDANGNDVVEHTAGALFDSLKIISGQVKGASSGIKNSPDYDEAQASAKPQK